MDIETEASKRRRQRAKKSETGRIVGRRELNKRDKHARIVAAARALFRAKGFHATTTQEIAEAAGIGSGTLFLYAKSKNDLLILVFMDEIAELLERVYKKVPAKAPLLDRAEALFRGIVQYHAADIDIAQALIREVTFLSNPDRKDDVNKIVEMIVAQLAELVAAAKAQGEVRADIDPGLAGRCLFATYYQQLVMWLSGYCTREAFETMLHDMLALYVAGLECRPGRGRHAAAAKHDI